MDTSFMGRPPTTPRQGENPESGRISGYRRLRDDDLAAVNALKALEQQVLAGLEQTKTFLESPDGPNGELGPDADQRRALAIARTEIETGFMWAIRAVARPVPFQPKPKSSCPTVIWDR